MDACPSCGARVATPLVCDACGVLLSPDSAPSPFEVFGLEPAYAVDREALRRRLLELTRRTHPDYFGSDGEQRELAERNTAELNAAFETLDDDFRRADWLVRSRGGPGEDDERQMPRAFLTEVLEWNETLEAVRAAADGSGPDSSAADMDGLESELTARRADTFAQLAGALKPVPAAGAPALTEARRLLNAARYLDRTLSEIGALRLAQASSS